jgi:cysteinyl-tRNA synthetase
MNFSWDALDGSNRRLAELRQRMAALASEGGTKVQTWTEERRELDRRFREAVGSDLDMPQALVVMNEAFASQSLPVGEKYALLESWDQVLGLDLTRSVGRDWRPSEEVAELIRRRDEARSTKDFAASDAIRDQLIAMGLEVMDTAEGTQVRTRT